MRREGTKPFPEAGSPEAIFDHHQEIGTNAYT